MTDTRKYYRVNEWCALNAISKRSFYREVAVGRIDESIALGGPDGN